MSEVGLKELLSDGDKFEVLGKTYVFKRLGIKNTMEVVALIQRAIAIGYHDLAFLSNLIETLASQNKDKAIAVATVLCGLVDLHDDLFKLIAKVIVREEDNYQLSLEDLYNPLMFPPFALLEILVALFNHQDLGSFFSHLLVMIDKLVPKVTVVTEKLAQNEDSKN